MVTHRYSPGSCSSRTFSVVSTVACFCPPPLPRNSSVSSGSRPLGPRLPGRRMRRKIALTWATPSSSLSATGTRIVSSMVYVFGSVGLVGKLILPHRRVVSPQGTTQELNPWGSPVNPGLPSSRIVLADILYSNGPSKGTQEGRPGGQEGSR